MSVKLLDKKRSKHTTLNCFFYPGPHQLNTGAFGLLKGSIYTGLSFFERPSREQKGDFQ
jgi:hypothetical protein